MAVRSDVFFADLQVIAEAPPIVEEVVESAACAFDKRIGQSQVTKAFIDPTRPTNRRRNDYFAPILFGDNSRDGYQIFLEKLVGCDFAEITEITDNTYGSLFGTQFIENVSYWYPKIYARIEWLNVYNLHGVGCYRLRYRYLNVFKLEEVIDYSYTTKVAIYNEKSVNNTVKLEYTNEGVNGDISNDTVRINYRDMSWTNMLRIDGGIKTTGFEAEKEAVRYRSGAQTTTKDDQVQNYNLSVEKLHVSMLRMLSVEILMADDIRITDYNVLNGEKFVNYRIAPVGGFEVSIDLSNFFTADIPVNQYFQNFQKKRRFIN
jgi:hypothetical protein